ncbi:MAG: hypothetical protein U0271_22480 [Polyangiaceae bacterium]
MSSDSPDLAAARALLHLPEQFDIPSTETLVEDARAMLLYSLSLRKELAASDIVVSPIWEGHAGEVSVRAAVVPAEVVARHFEGPGTAALRDSGMLEMIADVATVLLEDPVGAAKVLSSTEQLWVTFEAPVRSLEMPYRPHLKVLTLTIADFIRKIGAGFTELEWLTSMGLLDAYHDPSSDPPRETVLTATNAKTLAMCAEEATWMRALAAEG